MAGAAKMFLNTCVDILQLKALFLLQAVKGVFNLAVGYDKAVGL